MPPREIPAAGLLSAHFLHTTARGVEGGTPDPQLHSHCVITSVVRADGSLPPSHQGEARQTYLEEGTPLRASVGSQVRVDLRQAFWRPPALEPAPRDD